MSDLKDYGRVEVAEEERYVTMARDVANSLILDLAPFEQRGFLSEVERIVATHHQDKICESEELLNRAKDNFSEFKNHPIATDKGR